MSDITSYFASDSFRSDSFWNPTKLEVDPLSPTERTHIITHTLGQGDSCLRKSDCSELNISIHERGFVIVQRCTNLLREWNIDFDGNVQGEQVEVLDAVLFSLKAKEETDDFLA